MRALLIGEVIGTPAGLGKARRAIDSGMTVVAAETVKEHVAAVLPTLHVNTRANAVLAVNPLHSVLWNWRSRRAGLGLNR